MANIRLMPEWRTLLSACTPTQFGAISRLSGRLSDRGVTPRSLTDAHVQRVRADFVSEQRAAADAQTNAFIKHVNQLGKDQPKLGLPKLKEITSPRRDHKQTITSLPMQLRCDTAFFVLQKPNKNTVASRRNSIYRAAAAIRTKGVAIETLADLIKPGNVLIVARSFGPIDKRNRTRTGTLSVLMAASKHLKDEAAYDDIREVMHACAQDNPEISARTIRVCAPFHDPDHREEFFKDLVRRTRLPAALTEKALYDAQGAFLALFLVRFTLKPGFIFKLELNGEACEPQNQPRRRLSHPDFKVDFETLLLDREVEALALYHARLTEYLGEPPKAPFVTKTGDLRGEAAIHSLKQVLTDTGLRTEDEENSMQSLDLRDLGVRIRLQDGKLTVEQIAALALYDPLNFEIRFKPWIASLRDSKPNKKK
jgi:hypothetical protein